MTEPKTDLRMNAYYFAFNPTGVHAIDLILSAIACAGKAYHHTRDWCDDCPTYEDEHRGEYPVDWIQNAADDAAAMLRERENEAG